MRFPVAEIKGPFWRVICHNCGWTATTGTKTKASFLQTDHDSMCGIANPKSWNLKSK